MKLVAVIIHLTIELIFGGAYGPINGNSNCMSQKNTVLVFNPSQKIAPTSYPKILERLWTLNWLWLSRSMRIEWNQHILVIFRVVCPRKRKSSSHKSLSELQINVVAAMQSNRASWCESCMMRSYLRNLRWHMGLMRNHLV